MPRAVRSVPFQSVARSVRLFYSEISLANLYESDRFEPCALISPYESDRFEPGALASPYESNRFEPGALANPYESDRFEPDALASSFEAGRFEPDALASSGGFLGPFLGLWGSRECFDTGASALCYHASILCCQSLRAISELWYAAARVLTNTQQVNDHDNHSDHGETITFVSILGQLSGGARGPGGAARG